MVELASRHSASAQGEASEHEPGKRHKYRAGRRHREGDGLDSGRQIEQSYPKGGVLYYRPGTRAERADSHEDGACCAEEARSTHRDKFGGVEGSANSALIAVPAGDRRTERELAGCHVSTVTVQVVMPDLVRAPLLDPSIELRHTGVVKFPLDASGADASRATVSSTTHDGQTRRAIVQLLLKSGSITAAEIGSELGFSSAGIRRHLDALIESGDAEANAAAAWQHAGRGRPAKRYRLTQAGRAKLDHAYDDLASAAMRQLREIGGDEAVRTFARRRIDTILTGVETVANHDEDAVAAIADQVADALSKAGYVTTTTRVGGPLRGIEICQHHCPVSHVAAEFPELCEAEQQAMSEVLGTHVQRLATIANGDCACTTHVPLAPVHS